MLNGKSGFHKSPDFFVYFKCMKPKIYLFTVRYKLVWDDDWQFKNVVIENTVDLKSAMNALRKKFQDGAKIVVDNVYSEEMIL